MTGQIIIAVIALLGTFIGSYIPYMRNRNVIEYQIDELKLKMDKHNHMVERIYIVEGKVESACERLSRLERK